MPNKTIFMPQPLLDAWLAALRSGKYKQTCRGTLSDGTGYCCLGVLEHVADKRVEDDVLPTRAWLQAHNVVFKDSDGSIGENGTMRVPYLHGDGANDFASSLNDAGMSFMSLADAIERNAQRTRNLTMRKAIITAILFIVWCTMMIGVIWPVLALRGTVTDGLIALFLLITTFGFYAYVAEAVAFAFLKPPTK